MEYKTGHLNGSICIPLCDILNNPFTVCVVSLKLLGERQINFIKYLGENLD